MFNKITSAAIACYVAFSLTSCQNAGSSNNSEKNIAILSAIVQTQNLNAANATIASLVSSRFALNGSWNSFTGNATTLDTIVTISATKNSNGLILTDSSLYGGNSTCNIIVQFDNTAGYYIAQNPQNNGACFTPDSNKGMYFKNIFFAEGSKYWYCTIYTPTASITEALAVSDTTVKTNPGTTGCGGFSWSRLEKK